MTIRQIISVRLLIIALLLIARPVRGQYVLIGGGTAAGVNTAQTGPLLATGGNFAVAWVTEYPPGSSGNQPTDTQSNTYSLCGSTNINGNVDITIWYSEGGSYVTNMQVQVTSGSFTYFALEVRIFSGSTALPCDVSISTAKTSSPTTVLNSGSITPTQNNELCIAALGADQGATYTELTNYTNQGHVDYVSGHNEGLGYGWWIQTTATATNANWTWGTSTADASANTACFKAAPFSSGTTELLPLLGVGH